jgi:hypothetical protein
MKRTRPRAKRLVLDAMAQKVKELDRERGPRLEREALRASIAEHAAAKLGRLVDELNAG